jgi:hypothetical protein
MFSPINRIASICFLVCLVFLTGTIAQKNPAAVQTRKPSSAPQQKEKYFPGTVIDERLAVLRMEPSFYSIPLQRMRRGRTVLIYSSREVDGVTFYSVTVPPDKRGWLQADAVASAGRPGDDLRLARLIQASEGFEQIERAALFLETFANSPLRPAILLYQGDLLEETAQKLTFEAHKKLNAEEMSANGAPVYSFFLNYAGLDRYRRLGIGFLFNAGTRYFHYDGECWKELAARFPESKEAVEAKKRLDDLGKKMELKK